jgi:hypothetical protein
VEIKIKWIKRKQMTHENTYRDDNTLFHVYPTTARMENFAGLVKRHLAGFFYDYRSLTAFMEYKQDYSVTSVKDVKVCF